jgi:hypothetical protein
MSKVPCYIASVKRSGRDLKRSSFCWDLRYQHPISLNGAGVPRVSEVIELIREEFRDDVGQLSQLQRDLDASENGYQSAFRFFDRKKGPRRS